MAKPKKILVEDILKLTTDETLIAISFYAYGIHYSYSSDSGKTAKELKENLRYDCMRAQVGRIQNGLNGEIILSAEIVHS